MKSLSDYHLKNKKFVISVSYGNYLKYVGGTDKVIIAQKNSLLREGVSYVYIYPRVSRLYHYWELIIDDEFMGIVETNQFLTLISHFLQDDSCILQGMILHHLLKVNLSDLSQILNSIDMSVIMYIHDYYTVCENYFLLRDGKAFCGKGCVSQEKCIRNGISCKSYKGSLLRSGDIKNFFVRYQSRMRFVAPSETAACIFLSAYPFLDKRMNIIPHQKLVGSYENNFDKDIRKPIRVAYLGQQIAMKGWEYFKEFVEAQHIKERYEFYYFGIGEEIVPHVVNKYVSFQDSGENAMIEALREAQIDVVWLYSVWPETYSFTYYESMAANAFVITNQDSGNIAAQVRANGNGIVLGSVNELDEIDIAQAVYGWRKERKYGPEGLKSWTPNLLEGERGAKFVSTFKVGCKKGVQIKISVLQLMIKGKRFLKGK